MCLYRGRDGGGLRKKISVITDDPLEITEVSAIKICTVHTVTAVNMQFLNSFLDGIMVLVPLPLTKPV